MCKWNLYFKAISQVFRVKTHPGQGWGPNAQQRTSWGVGAGSVCPSVGTSLLSRHPTSEDLPRNTGINTGCAWMAACARAFYSPQPRQRQVCWGWDHLLGCGLAMPRASHRGTDCATAHMCLVLHIFSDVHVKRRINGEVWWLLGSVWGVHPASQFWFWDYAYSLHN